MSELLEGQTLKESALNPEDMMVVDFSAVTRDGRRFRAMLERLPNGDYKVRHSGDVNWFDAYRLGDVCAVLSGLDLSVDDLEGFNVEGEDEDVHLFYIHTTDRFIGR